MTIKKVSLLALLLFPLFSYSTTFYVDYDGDGAKDSITEEYYLDKIKLTMVLSSVDNSKFEYFIEKYDDEIMPRSHKSFVPGEIEIDSSYPSQGGIVYSQLYKWDIDKKNWYLIKVIDGEKENYLDQVYIPTLNIQRIQCCYYLGNNSFSFHEIAENKVNIEILDELSTLKLLLNSNNKDEIIKKINIYSATEYVKYLNVENRDLLNALANIVRDSDWQASTIILQQIVREYPERLESLLDLANAYWDSGEPIIQEEAVLLYKKYKKMNLSNKNHLTHKH